MPKAIITDGFAVNPGDLSWEPISKICDLRVYEKLTDEEAAELIEDAECIFTNRTKITRNVLEQHPAVKFISAMGTGFDMIDIEACKEKEITVCNVPGYSTPSVAQVAFALLLNTAFDLNGFASSVKNGKWTGMPGFHFEHYRFTELAGKTIGIFGCGSIGTKMAKICKSFDMRVLATKKSRTSGNEDGIEFTSPDDLLHNSDFVSIHCPLNNETRGMVDKNFISKMKDGAVLINTSRGAVLNEQDVADALFRGKLSGLGVDVLATEPPVPDNPLLSAPNTIISPHCAWTSKEARIRLIDCLAKNLNEYIAGQKPSNSVI